MRRIRIILHRCHRLIRRLFLCQLILRLFSLRELRGRISERLSRLVRWRIQGDSMGVGDTLHEEGAYFQPSCQTLGALDPGFRDSRLDGIRRKDGDLFLDQSILFELL